MKIGLRIDVDTLRGTARGVPRLLRALAVHDITASFFFSVGPDNMGRHLWRLRRPAFLWKMMRTRAPSLYGWDILLRGTFWPGPRIGRRCRDVIRATADAGHEIGLHAWDHHAWQMRVEKMSPGEIQAVIARGRSELADLAGREPTCSAAPGWRCTETVLRAKAAFPFAYNSDCRGDRVFRPVVDGAVLDQVQVPVSLPTWDELIGDGVSAEQYSEHLLGRLRADALNVLTIHGEVEGIVGAAMFERFLELARQRGGRFLPLGALAAEARAEPGRIEARRIPGREGTVACLAEMSAVA